MNTQKYGEFYERSQTQGDLDLQRQHGRIADVHVLQFIEPMAKYECVLTFEDGFQLPSVRSRENIERLQSSIAANFASQEDDAVEQQENQERQVQEEHREEQQRRVQAEQRQRTRINNHQKLLDERQLSLREYAQQTPQRTRLLNGKLFTRDLLLQTQRGGIPEALK